MARSLLLAALFAMASSYVFAADPGPLQDFCVADLTSPVIVNGYVCKNPKNVTAEDFFFSNLLTPSITFKKLGFQVSLATVSQLPGLNTLGVSMVRTVVVPGGVVAPHIHSRATEIITIIEGTLNAGFVTSNPSNQYFTKVLNKGDVFVFPQGLVHFQYNNGSEDAVGIVAFNSQNPDVTTIANAVFGSNPPIYDEVLAKAFQLDKKTIDWLQAQFSPNNTS